MIPALVSEFLRETFTKAGIATSDTLRDDRKILQAVDIAFRALPFPMRAALKLALGKAGIEQYALAFRDQILQGKSTPNSSAQSLSTGTNATLATADAHEVGTMKLELTRSKVPVVGLLGGSKGNDYKVHMRVSLGNDEASLFEYGKAKRGPVSTDTFPVLSDPEKIFLQKRFSSASEVKEFDSILLDELLKDGRTYVFSSPTAMSNFEAYILEGLHSVKSTFSRLSAFRTFEAEAEARAVKGGTETIEV